MQFRDQILIYWMISVDNMELLHYCKNLSHFKSYKNLRYNCINDILPLKNFIINHTKNVLSILINNIFHLFLVINLIKNNANVIKI
jgi:hypothetical protein